MDQAWDIGGMPQSRQYKKASKKLKEVSEYVKTRWFYKHLVKGAIHRSPKVPIGFDMGTHPYEVKKVKMLAGEVPVKTWSRLRTIAGKLSSSVILRQSKSW